MSVRSPFTLRSAILGCAFAVSACANHAAVPTVPTPGIGAASGSSMTAASAKSNDVLYAGIDMTGGSIVNAFTSSGATTRTVQDGLGGAIGGVALDSKGRLYVAEDSVGIVAYANGSPVPAGFYGDPLREGASFEGLLIGTNSIYIETAATGTTTNPRVLEYPIRSYPLGATRPIRTITLPTGAAVFGGMALDANHNLYVVYSAPGFPATGEFLEFPRGSTTGKKLHVHVGNPGPGLAIDSHGNLVACDNEFSKIEVFAASKHGFDSKPARTIDQGLADCASFVFSSDGRSLYVDDQTLALGDYQPPAKINVYNYASGKLEKTIANGFQQPQVGDFLYLAIGPPASHGP